MFHLPGSEAWPQGQTHTELLLHSSSTCCRWDMGLLANKGSVDQDAFVVQQFVSADRDKDNKLSYEEFVEYYAKVSGAQEGQRR